MNKRWNFKNGSFELFEGHKGSPRLAQRVAYGTLASQGLPKLRIFIIPSIHFLRTSAYDSLFKSATAFFTNIFRLDFTAMVILHGIVLPITNYPGLGVPKQIPPKPPLLSPLRPSFSLRDGALYSTSVFPALILVSGSPPKPMMQHSCLRRKA